MSGEEACGRPLADALELGCTGGLLECAPDLGVPAAERGREDVPEEVHAPEHESGDASRVCACVQKRQRGAVASTEQQEPRGVAVPTDALDVGDGVSGGVAFEGVSRPRQTTPTLVEEEDVERSRVEAQQAPHPAWVARATGAAVHADDQRPVGAAVVREVQLVARGDAEELGLVRGGRG